MSLLDDLRAIEHFPPSHLPSVSEVLELMGKLIAHAEHGEKLLQAVEDDRKAREAGEPATHLGELLSPPEQEQPPAAPVPVAGGPAVAGATPASAPAAVDAAPPVNAPVAADDRDARIADLEQQLQTLRAQQQRTQVDVQPGPEVPSSAATPDPSVAPREGGW